MRFKKSLKTLLSLIAPCFLLSCNNGGSDERSNSAPVTQQQPYYYQPSYQPQPQPYYYQPYQPQPYGRVAPGSRFYSNPYAIPPSTYNPYYDSDQYYVPPTYYNNVETQQRPPSAPNSGAGGAF